MPKSLAEQVREVAVQHPEWRDIDVARTVGASPAYVWDVRHGPKAFQRLERTRQRLAQEQRRLLTPPVSTQLALVCPHCGGTSRYQITVAPE